MWKEHDGQLLATLRYNMVQLRTTSRLISNHTKTDYAFLLVSLASAWEPSKLNQLKSEVQVDSLLHSKMHVDDLAPDTASFLGRRSLRAMEWPRYRRSI